MSGASITPELIAQHGLTPEEYRRIVSILGREPNLTELGIFSVMWSEHCSYKSSRLYLKRLPTQGPAVVQGPGENAGAIDIGDGLVAIFKIESHNHPSFIEPYQGAATGVGGIIRDIFTMGARPIALLDSLHFGPPQDKRSRLIMEGVVAGISGYGNSVGVPTVGGETYFAECYASNPIVNIFCLGLARRDRIFLGRAYGPGNPVIYVGAKTGRDGIHGATMASAEFGAEAHEKRPNVQIGDPFLEKLLIEACLEAMKTGAVVGIQDMGAAGLTCSSCEMAARAGTGIEIDLSKVPQREPAMTAYEIMLSESQERMLLVVQKGREQEVLEIFARWGLDAVLVGQVTGDGLLRVKLDERVEAEIASRALTDQAPVYERPRWRPQYLDEVNRLDADSLTEPRDYNRALLDLVSSPNLGSKRWIFEQYDYMVRTNTLLPPVADSAVLRIKGTGRGLAIKLDGNPRYCYLDPRAGAKIAVAESCRNLVAVGARPVAATNCLNFASPENPEVMWQFVETVEGLAEACRYFGTPITGGNVSFYNETLGRGIYPTPVVGMVGIIEDLSLLVTPWFKDEGDLVVLLGANKEELGGSEYLKVAHGLERGLPPMLDLELELSVQRACAEAIAARLVKSAHDCSEGGLAAALAECSLLSPRNLGCALEIESEIRPDALLFGESQSRFVLSIDPANLDKLSEAAARHGAPLTVLGRTAARRLTVSVNGKELVSLEISQLRPAWQESLSKFVLR